MVDFARPRIFQSRSRVLVIHAYLSRAHSNEAPIRSGIHKKKTELQRVSKFMTVRVSPYVARTNWYVLLKDNEEKGNGNDLGNKSHWKLRFCMKNIGQFIKRIR